MARIMIIEDDPDIREELTLLLEMRDILLCRLRSLQMYLVRQRGNTRT